MSEVQSEVKDVSAIKKKIEVSIPEDMVRAALEKEYEKVGKNAKLKGFRKGKVPRHILEQYYSENVEHDTMERLVRETYPDAVEKHMVVPISAPYVEPGPFAKDKPFSYVATFEIRPIVDIKEYNGLKLEHPEVTVTKEDIDNQLEVVRQHMTQLEPSPDDAKAEKGMVVTVDFKGTVDGKPFKGSEANDFLVELGAENMLPQFEVALEGLKRGDERDVSINYPEDYFNKELAGKNGKFQLKVKDLKKKIVPELNDSLAKDLGDFKTLDDVKKDIEKRILEAREQDVKRILSSQVVERLVEKHPFEVPESMTNSELKIMFENFVRYLGSQGKKLEDTGLTIENFIDKYKKDAENRVRGFLIIDAIAEVEKIGVTDEEVEARLKLIAEQSSQTLPKVKQQYEAQNLMNGLNIQLKHEKTLDLVINKAKITINKPKKDKKSE